MFGSKIRKQNRRAEPQRTELANKTGVTYACRRKVLDGAAVPGDLH